MTDVGKLVATLGLNTSPFSVSTLVKYASEITTKSGNTYYKIPYWFKVSSDGENIEFLKKMPEDLSEFVCKARLGNPNPQIKNSKE